MMVVQTTLFTVVVYIVQAVKMYDKRMQMAHCFDSFLFYLLPTLLLPPPPPPSPPLSSSLSSTSLPLSTPPPSTQMLSSAMLEPLLARVSL